MVLNYEPTRHTLVYKQKEYAMHIPLDFHDFIDMETVIKDMKKEEKEYTDCTFFTTWSIEDGQLYLVYIFIVCNSSESYRMGCCLTEELFDNKKIKASWVKNHVISIICKDEKQPMKLHITINNGLVVEEEKRSYNPCT